MIKRDEITKYLANLFEIEKIDDYAYNGLQIEGTEDIKKIGFSVDFCQKTAEEAIKNNCQMLICHHGMMWKNILPVTGSNKKRIKTMLLNDVSLYAVHLPLDMHLELGNNIGIAKLFDNFEVIGQFAYFKGKPIGVKIKLDTPKKLSEIKKLIDEKLKTNSILISNEENKIISTIGIISGSSASDLSEAIKEELDLFITGETSHAQYHTAMENNTSMLCAGHYATETTGIKLLMNHIKEKFDVETEFFDFPTGI